jgi:DNA-binding LacI/PurR family transcriptional regulator
MSITRIAQAANVSYATAWRIINNRPCSSEQAVAAVKRAMGQLGYKPAEGTRRGRPARSADGIRTRNIALLHLREGTAISTSVLARVQRMLAEINLNLIFAHGNGADVLPQAVRAGNVDGILGYGQIHPDAITDKIQKIPAVWMMSRSDAQSDPWGDRVKPDHGTIGQIAAQHLLARGHTRLAYMNPDTNLSLYQQRLLAFHATSQSAGTSLEVFGMSGSTDMDFIAERLVEQWMATSPRPTGIFVPVDRATLSVYRHLERNGIQPGRDVDVVSCDNEKELLSLMRPAPPSIDLNRTTIARLAVERLLWRMKNGTASPSIVITVTPTLVAPSNGAVN